MPTLEQMLPPWLQQYAQVVVPAIQITLIICIAYILRMLLHRIINRLSQRYSFPYELIVGSKRTSTFIIYAAAFFLILDRLGVSGTVLWTAFTGFAAVAAVAFFAAWSVLSNIFCTLLIFTTRPFRLNDQIELLDNGEKPGLKGRVVDINLIYTTLQETGDYKEGTVLQIPNSLFFQKVTRRWKNTNIEAP